MITIRSLQHYMYCPRRWGLIEIEKKWEDNYFIIKSNIAHENVHQGVHGYKSASKYVCSNVTVYSDLYDLYGVVDCLEFIKTSDGTWIDFLKGCYFLNIVEYKPSMKKTIGDVNRFEDEMQVYAQKICIDEIYKTNCSADIYYTTERKRKKVDFENTIADYITFESNMITHGKGYLFMGSELDGISK